jgi:hypothetical chaperone protein
MPQPPIGIDFGTTNSSVARASGSGTVDLLTFPTATTPTPSFRSILYLEHLKQATRTTTQSFTGPQAIERYLAAENPGRLIQSLKSWLPSRSLTGTEVFGRRYTLEDLISRILTDLRRAAEARFGNEIRHAVVGRPVRFVGADTPEDETFALTRLTEAFHLAGFEQVTFELEPVAAAFSYESTLTADETILIGDFGGGTSDFSLVRVGPSAARLPSAERILAPAGLPLAGDAFDARIVRHLVSPALGADTLARSGDKLLPAAPAWIYANLERWHYLSFLKTRNVTEILRGARLRVSRNSPESEDVQKIEALINLIDEDLRYQLHGAVQRLKIALSTDTLANFHFCDGSLDISAEVTRANFELWIADHLQAIATTVDDLLTTAALAPTEIDRVFLTGGTSFVPAVRRLFESRFGPEKVVTGNEFTSVARGLALRAALQN